MMRENGRGTSERRADQETLDYEASDHEPGDHEPTVRQASSADQEISHNEEPENGERHEPEDVEQHLETLRKQLAPLCQSKAEELVLWGYEQVEPDLIWKIAAEDARKKRTLQIHQVANAILSLKPNLLMNYLMKEMYRRSSSD